MKLYYKKMSLLLVDSNPMALDTMEGYLEPFDFFRVWTAQKVDEAQKLLQEREVNLVICATRLQPISGTQFLQMLRQRKKPHELPVIMLMTHSDPNLGKQLVEFGADGVLSLPLDPGILRQTVEQALAGCVDEDEEEFLQHRDQGRKAANREQWDQAEISFRKALECKDDETVRMALGRVLKHKGEIDEAAEIFQDTIDKNPDCLKAYVSLAAICKQRGDLEEALRIMTQAAEVAARLKESGATRASIYFYMGEIDLQLQKLAEALGCFDKAAELFPDDPKLQGRIGDVLAKCGQFKESEGYYQKALEIDPRMAHVYNRLGIAYRRQAKYDLALGLYRKAMEFNPDDEHLLYNEARCLWEKGDHAAAAASLKKSLEINPEFAEAAQFIEVIRNHLKGKVSLDD